MTTATRTARHGAVLVPGGTFRMGSDRFYPEAAPVRTAVVPDLWVDEHPVTNAQFRRFVTTTGHVTVAERPRLPATSRAPTPVTWSPVSGHRRPGAAGRLDALVTPGTPGPTACATGQPPARGRRSAARRAPGLPVRQRPDRSSEARDEARAAASGGTALSP
jgi:formylglycine-generating enzyme required for sulfatase activity